jgi:hypothetical protein
MWQDDFKEILAGGMSLNDNVVIVMYSIVKSIKDREPS